jgi:hypothetical protein
LLSPHNEGEGPRGGSLNTSPPFTPSRRKKEKEGRKERGREREKKEGEQGEIKQE